MVVNYIDWHEMLPYTLHKYLTSIRTSTKATTYSLVYGMEVVLPVEIEIPSLRVVVEAELGDTDWRAFDKRTCPRTFHEGDLVLKKLFPTSKDRKGKWTPNYEGSYIVKWAFSRGALILTNLEDQDLKHPFNADLVKKFYP
ncbi:hypothetical protein CR513_56591, partial [Mucuna pruriens]